MTSKTTLTSNPTETINNYAHASRLARILLGSHEKHDDLPLIIHAQACLVLGCSDEDDCYERMEDAVFLLTHAMEEGVLAREDLSDHLEIRTQGLHRTPHFILPRSAEEAPRCQVQA